MPPKKGSNSTSKSKLDKSKKQPTTSSSAWTSTTVLSIPCCNISVLLELSCQLETPREALKLCVMFNGEILCTKTWDDGRQIDLGNLPVDLMNLNHQTLLANNPLIFSVRSTVVSGKGGKGKVDPDPWLAPDIRSVGNADMWPIVLGEPEMLVDVPLVSVETETFGEYSGFNVLVRAVTIGEIPEKTHIPLLITMISAHCLPQSKDGTIYIAAIGLDELRDEPMSAHFGMSLTNALTEKTVWATINSGSPVANTTYHVPNEDKFVPEELDIRDGSSCRSMYWNSLRRTLVDPLKLRDRLAAPLFIEVAGIPRIGKPEVRGRYMGFIEALPLLEPGERGLTACAKLIYFDEKDLPENACPVLNLPVASGKASARSYGPVLDEFEHNTYVTIRFDLLEPLIPKVRLPALYQMIGFPPPEGQKTNQDILYIEPPPEDTVVDVRHIRVECGALAVHKELSGLACRGAIPMNQGIKRTAANRLLTRTRTMLKQFPPGDCSYIEWQDTVAGQHAAARRAVSHSFAPQPPPLRLTHVSAAVKCRIAGDIRISDKYIEQNLKANSKHPRNLLSKALRCLEARQDREAKKYILQGLSSQTRSRFLLWLYGAQEFNQGEEVIDAAKAAFRIAVKGDYVNGTACAIGWAALHALDHYNYRPYAAFVAAKKMRKSYELIKEWKEFLQRWSNTSGEEEVLWTPSAINSYNPMLIASAFFLCLRCYTFSERLLQCYEGGCGTRGSRLCLVTKITPDVYYLRAASWLLRRNIGEALKITKEGVTRFGPSALLSEMQASCLSCLNGCDEAREAALFEAEISGADCCPSLLLSAALRGMRENPEKALQRAALAHKKLPSGYTALAIGRVYMTLGDLNLAERWAAVSVKYEPYLADGWAFLAVLALKNKLGDKARAMLRTARQVGPVSEDIEEQLRKLMDIVKIEKLSDKMMRDLCLCDYLNPLHDVPYVKKLPYSI